MDEYQALTFLYEPNRTVCLAVTGQTRTGARASSSWTPHRGDRRSRAEIRHLFRT